MKISKENFMISIASGIITYSMSPTESKAFAVFIGISAAALLLFLFTRKARGNAD